MDGQWEAGLAPQEGSSPRRGGETREERRGELRTGPGARREGRRRQRAEAPQRPARASRSRERWIIPGSNAVRAMLRVTRVVMGTSGAGVRSGLQPGVTQVAARMLSGGVSPGPVLLVPAPLRRDGLPAVLAGKWPQSPRRKPRFRQDAEGSDSL